MLISGNMMGAHDQHRAVGSVQETCAKWGFGRGIDGGGGKRIHLRGLYGIGGGGDHGVCGKDSALQPAGVVGRDRSPEVRPVLRHSNDGVAYPSLSCGILRNGKRPSQHACRPGVCNEPA